MPQNRLHPTVFDLSPDYVLGLHDEVVAIRFPGIEPVGPGELIDRGLLESAVLRPFQSAGGQEIHPSLAAKAAALFHGLIANHPFHNGNKRTAVLAVDHFLMANRRFLSLSDPEVLDLATRTATCRQRGVKQEDMLGELTGAFENSSVGLSGLLGAGFVRLSIWVFRASRAIRRHKSNS